MAFHKRCHFNCRHLKAKVWFSALCAWDHVLSETFSLCESGKPISSAGQKPLRWQWLVTVHFSFCIMWPCCGLWAAFFPPLIFARLPVHHMNTASHSKLVFPERIHCVSENTLRSCFIWDDETVRSQSQDRWGEHGRFFFLDQMTEMIWASQMCPEIKMSFFYF